MDKGDSVITTQQKKAVRLLRQSGFPTMAGDAYYYWDEGYVFSPNSLLAFQVPAPVVQEIIEANKEIDSNYGMIDG